MAYEHFEKARELRRTGWLPPSTAIEILSAIAAAQSGLLEEARDRLEALFETTVSSETQAQILAWLAVVDMYRGDTPAAEARADTAWALAAEAGKRDLLLRVAAVTGSAFQYAGRKTRAVELYKQALALADAGATPPSAVDLLASGVGLLESCEFDRLLSLRLLQILPKALKHPDSWRLMHRLLKIIEGSMEEFIPLLDLPTIDKQLNFLTLCCSQREKGYKYSAF